MKKLSILLIIFCLSLKAYSAELPIDLKSLLKKKYTNIVFRIDNSFIVNNQIYIPLIPENIKTVKKINLMEAWRQVNRDASIAHNSPLLAIRFDHMPPKEWLIVLHSNDWMELLKNQK